MNVHGKVAIITGAATGIGRAIATEFVRGGAAVTIDYVGNSEHADELVKALQRDDGKAIAIAADVSDEQQVAMLVDQTVHTFGRLDIMVNNAGIEQQHPFLETSRSAWDKVIAVNLTGPLLVRAARGEADGRAGRRRPHHQHLVGPRRPADADQRPYCAAKGGLRMLMRTIAVELAPHEITVNNIGPGAIDTPMDAAHQGDPERMQTLLAEIPLGRMGQPEEVARALRVSWPPTPPPTSPARRTSSTAA